MLVVVGVSTYFSYKHVCTQKTEIPPSPTGPLGPGGAGTLSLGWRLLPVISWLLSGSVHLLRGDHHCILTKQYINLPSVLRDNSHTVHKIIQDSIVPS